MRQPVRKTGPYGIGSMVHVVHVADDIHRLNRWYEDVFGGVVFVGTDQPGHMASEKRSACLVLVSDYCIETMSPDLPLDLSTPIARFFERSGPRFHSLAWATDDVDGLRSHLDANEVPCQLTDTGTYRFFFTSPRLTNGLMAEFISGEMPNDPRTRDDWSSMRKTWVRHPLGIIGLSHVTIGADDLADAEARWQRLWAPVAIGKEPDDALDAECSWQRLGDLVVQLAQPRSPGSPLATHVDRFGSSIYAVTFAVQDLASVEAHLDRHGIRTSRLSEDTLRADPADCFGAVYNFTTRVVGGDRTWG